MSNYSKSSTFYKLEKQIDKNNFSIFEFHTVVNGKMYCVEHEEYLDTFGNRCNGAYNVSKKDFKDKEEGNAYYKKLKSQGYKYVGTFIMDVCGYKEKINV